MTSNRPASHARLKGFSSRSAKACEDRASAQSRIAASTPKTTYGKHKNKLLPLTGSQFLRSDTRDVINDSKRMSAGNSSTHGLQQQPSDSEDSEESPLSGADLSEDIESSRQDKIRTKRVAIVTTKSTTQPRQFHQPVAADSPSLTSESEPEESRPAARSYKQPNRKRGTQKTHRQSPPVKKAGKLKPTGVVRGRLPLKELVLVPGTDKDDRFAQAPRTTNGMLPKDPISSSARHLLDAVSSDESDATPAKRKARAPLNTIRKRLRTPSSGHKSLQRLRSKMKAGQFTPTGSQPQQIIGDGFKDSELSLTNRPLFVTKHVRKQREPLLAGLQALTLANGPLPEVDFVPISQLQFNDHQTCHQGTSMSEDPAIVADAVSGPLAMSNRRVSFKGSQDRIISAQLASVSAPRRERSLTPESENDDGNEGGDEDNDDEAADTYLDDDDERPAEDLQPALSEDEDGICDSSPIALSEPQTPGSNASLFLRDGSLSARLNRHDRSSKLQRSRASSFLQRTVSGRPYLNEVNEPIDDDFRVDEMLLGDIEGRHKIVDHSDPIDAIRSRLAEVARSSNRDRPPKQIQLGAVSSIQPRSILKNSTPYISSDSNRPESTAANTRRNSMVDVEESRYFAAAKDQLDSTPTEPVIIRKKSGSRYYAPVEVPYSDDMVPETTPEQPDYTNTSQLHTLRRNTEALWISSAAPAPQKDLRSLTRSVSRDNGTLNQSVRRRSSLHFQSPMVGR